MARVHLLNVSPGDCTIIQHESDRTTMIDICDGNIPEAAEQLRGLGLLGLHMQGGPLAPARGLRRPGTGLLGGLATAALSANQRMCEKPTNPIAYYRRLNAGKAFRFVLTHPDMDHLDGFDRLVDEIGILNYWDSGARKSKKPDFSGAPYREEDWDRYARVRDGLEDGVTVVRHLAGSRFSLANRNEDGQGSGDGLYILAPDQALLRDLDEDDDLNDASYVLLYRSPGGRILLPGDAHDRSWEYVLANYASDIRDASFLLAPHHGRDSERSYDFLDAARPKLTLIGCCPAEYIDYEQWRRRGLRFVTSNQTGNVVLETAAGALNVYVENEQFAVANGGNALYRNAEGYTFLCTIPATPEA